MLSEEAVDLFQRSVLCWLATVSPEGFPNVSPKEAFVVRDSETVLIADIASPKSVRNVRANPAVCVAAVDVFEQKGFQAFGRAHVVAADDDDFATLAAPLRDLLGDAFPIRNVIAVAVDRLVPIVAPSYWLQPGRSDRDRRDSALRRYGVQETRT